MSDNPLYAELDRLRTELAANKAVVVRLEEQRAAEAEKARRWQAKWLEMRKAEHELSDAYLRLRRKLNAIKTPTTMPVEQMWVYTEGKLDELIGRVRELEAEMAAMRQALRAWRAWCLDERHSVADDTQLFEQAIELMDDALGTKEAQDAGAD